MSVHTVHPHLREISLCGARCAHIINSRMVGHFNHLHLMPTAAVKGWAKLKNSLRELSKYGKGLDNGIIQYFLLQIMTPEG